MLTRFLLNAFRFVRSWHMVRIVRVVALVAVLSWVFASPMVPRTLEAAAGDACGWDGSCNPDGSGDAVAGWACDNGTCVETPEMPLAAVPFFLLIAGLMVMRARKRTLGAVMVRSR